jgi:DNA-binding IclR family transcriptional regulator
MRNEHKGLLAAPRVPVGRLWLRTYSRNVTSGAAGGDRDPGPSQVQSVDRAVAILYLLAQHGEAGVTAIANELGVHKSTAFRLIAALEHGNLIEQAGERGKYHLGRGVLRLAAATTGRLELPAEARPVCRRLATELGEAVNIAILDSGEATHILQEYAKSAITGRNWLGQRTPLHATASGKVLLAYADPVTVKETFEAALQPYTPRTVTDPAALEADLATVRERGWASTAEEYERRSSPRWACPAPPTGSPWSPSRLQLLSSLQEPGRSASGSAISEQGRSSPDACPVDGRRTIHRWNDQ